MRVLVAYGSKRGGTAELAEWLAEELNEEGVVADAIDAREVDDVAPYDLVVVGGALYMYRWHRQARRFVRRHNAELRERPVYMFSSGPLDESATDSDVPPTRQVRQLMERVEAREHVTFGGRLEHDARGFPARAMAKNMSGDYRHRALVKAWARHIIDEANTMEGRAA